eukprot:3011918-Pyramimonas_sp.AAC.1
MRPRVSRGRRTPSRSTSSWAVIPMLARTRSPRPLYSAGNCPRHGQRDCEGAEVRQLRRQGDCEHGHRHEDRVV